MPDMSFEAGMQVAFPVARLTRFAFPGEALPVLELLSPFLRLALASQCIGTLKS